MTKGKTFGVSVSLTNEAIAIINGYMHKTRRNFSQTLNIIVQEWDNFSIAIEKYKRKQEAETFTKDYKQAVVEK